MNKLKSNPKLEFKFESKFGGKVFKTYPSFPLFDGREGRERSFRNWTAVYRCWMKSFAIYGGNNNVPFCLFFI